MPDLDLPLDGPLDLLGTLRILVRGHGDRTIRVTSNRAWWTTRTPSGAATVAVRIEGDRLRGEAYGPGAAEALARAPGFVGVRSGGRPPPGVDGGHRLVAELFRRHPGIRLPRTEAVLDALVPAIIEQKVTGTEARRSWQGLVRAHGESAPGPPELGLRLAPPAATLAALPYHAYHPFGIERRRAEVIRRVAARAAWFESIVDLPVAEAHARLEAVPGIGPWTANEVAVRALGDPDAVSVGDFHLPNLIAWALAREPRANDARMLELLEPYRGQRARVVRLLELSGIRPPRFGPRLGVRGIEGI